MDFEDELCDAGDNFGYSSDYGDDFDYNSDAGDDLDYDNDAGADDLPARCMQENYVVLTEQDILRRQEDDITRISATLFVSREAASILLRQFRWDVNKIHEEWFANEERVRKLAGLENPTSIPDPRAGGKEELLRCAICFDYYYECSDNFRSADCGHPFCTACWQRYVQTAIEDGPRCLILRCPEPSCQLVVDSEMIMNTLDSEEYKGKYRRFLLRSYIESSKTAKWCPAPDCDYAVEFALGSGSYDVSCLCSYRFCWNCKEDAHRPVDCGTVAKWVLKNNAESENMEWILANSKACPRCKYPIEKNQGCMHMTCRPPCGYQFCWLCLGPWSKHGENTGGFYACNKYEIERSEGKHREEERKIKMAKESIQRYIHYYERWAANNSSRLKALADLKKFDGEYFDKLSSHYAQTEIEMNVLREGLVQIAECRRVLKWTYAYGYYLPEKEEEDRSKKQFFEYLQGEAEAALERLHLCAEVELQKYLPVPGVPYVPPPLPQFQQFRTRLAELTTVTRNYFDNLVRILENGREDMASRCPTQES